ncbi:heparinase II/III family protein [Phytomonospora sp. NPDC050363]|uniref:heparinase II/III family protein n=1 Tax=Phytomonospora sp. NPDC050363 TaxID=3155642 RepID=UPI0033CD5863
MYTLTQIRAAIDEAAPTPILDEAAFRAVAERPELAELLAGVRAEAADTAPLPELTHELYGRYVRDGDRMAYERRYFARRGRLAARAAAALVDRRPEDLARLDEVLWQICDEYSWCLPAHKYHADLFGRTPDLGVDLFAAETAHTLAETVGLLRGELDPETVARVENEVRRRVLAPWLDDIRPQHWETMTNNWSAVCAGAAGMAALWLDEGEPRRLTGIIDRAQRAMAVFRSGFEADGGCPEGLSYWVYGYGYFVYFADALRARTGLDMLPETAAIAAFPAVVDFGEGRCVSFSDGGEDAWVPTGLASHLNARLGTTVPELTGVPDFAADHCHRWAHLSRNLLWTDPELIGRRGPDRRDYLPDLAWVVDRSTVDGVRIGFAAKGGHNAEPHNHNDLGHFLLYCGGEQLLADLGAGLYDKSYFSPQRYDSIYPSAEGHSVPVIDGAVQQPGRDREAVVLAHRDTGEGVHFALDLSAAYDIEGSFTRVLDWWSTGELSIRDRFTTAGLPLVERFVSRVEPALGDGIIVWRGEHGQATLTYAAEHFTATADRIETVDHHENPDVVHRLHLTGTTAAEHSLTITLEVFDGEILEES